MDAFHTHDRRICWDCGGVGIVARAISLRVVERTLGQLGWRFLEPQGRMVCSSCAWERRAARAQVWRSGGEEPSR